MKTVRMLGERRADVIEVADPVPRDNQVVVKIIASAICGTERHFYEDPLISTEPRGRDNGGHEAAGIVWKVDSSRLLREGDRVMLFAAYQHCGRCEYCWSGRWTFCQGEGRPPVRSGNHAQYVLMRDDFCLPLPDDLDFETGALLTDNLGTPFRAIKRLRVNARDSVLVVGTGPVGLAATMLCRAMGAPVVAADVNAYRLSVASRCGANAVIDPSREDLNARIREFTGADGVTVAIDTSGSQEGRLACLEGVGRAGRVAFIGIGAGLQLDPAQARDAFIFKEVEIIGSWYSDPADMVELAGLIRRGLEPSRMVTHRFGIDAAPEAFATCFDGIGAKVVIRPWSE